MVVENFEEMLINAKFNKIDFNISQMKIFYQVYGEKVYVFHVCDATRGTFFDGKSYQEVLQTIKEQFERQGIYETAILSVIFTADMPWVRALAKEEQSVWIVDTMCNRLMIYENQPSDFLGIRSYLERMLEDTPVQKVPTKQRKYFSLCNTCIVLVNVIIFLFMEFTGNTQDAYYMAEHGAMYVPYMVNNGEMYRLFTAMWIHFGVEHLFGNVLPLLLLGDNLERAVGRKKYMIIYLFSGLGASMCSFLFNLVTASYAVAAGASGAIFGVIGALFYVVAYNRGRLEDLTVGRLGVLILYILYTGIATPGIDNAAHIGGLGIGFLLAVVLYQKRAV